MHDVCRVPMVFIGEEAADKKLMNNRRLYRRFVEIVRFEKLDTEGVKKFLEEMSEVRWSDDAVDHVAQESGGRISQVIMIVHRLESWARRNNTKIINGRDLR